MKINEIKNDFPILQKIVNGKPLTYLDNAATTLTPNPVVEALKDYYLNQNANIHRGVHHLAEVATENYEKTRTIVKEFIKAKSTNEIVFTSGTTASNNLVAYSYGLANLKAGDEVIISGMEHHSNIIPWQIVTEKVGAELKVIPINERGELILEEFYRLLSDKTKIVAVVYVSNSLGTINPVEEIIKASHEKGAVVLADGAQAVSHLEVDVEALDVDFFSFSGHKLFGPTGVGVLYGKEELLKSMPPFLGGGEMIEKVTFTGSTYREPPYRFEAGTPAISEVIALGTAITWFKSIPTAFIKEHEHSLKEKLTKSLEEIPQVKLIGTAANKVPVASFALENIHPHDIGSILDNEGVAVRAGHHCTQPVMTFFGVPATTRASLSLYNDETDIERLVEGIKKVIEVMG